MITDPASYDQWYQTGRGRWISNIEFEILRQQIDSRVGCSLLDVGCGTGHFTRRFEDAGFAVTALDVDERMLCYARSVSQRSDYVQGDVCALPFADKYFDHCVAITSLCFVADMQLAVSEMLRVARRTVVLGLLNRNSLLYYQKHDRGSYKGARWDDIHFMGLTGAIDVLFQRQVQTALFLPSGGVLARVAESLIPQWLPWGSFLVVSFRMDKGL